MVGEGVRLVWKYELARFLFPSPTLLARRFAPRPISHCQLIALLVVTSLVVVGAMHFTWRGLPIGLDAGTQGQVRLDEERSDELTTQIASDQSAHAHTSVQGEPPPQPPQYFSSVVPTPFAIRFAHRRD